MASATRRNASRGRNGEPEASTSGPQTRNRVGPAEWTDDMLQEERNQLIEQKQREAARVFEKHDDLVSTVSRYTMA